MCADEVVSKVSCGSNPGDSAPSVASETWDEEKVSTDGAWEDQLVVMNLISGTSRYCFSVSTNNKYVLYIYLYTFIVFV